MPTKKKPATKKAPAKKPEETPEPKVTETRYPVPQVKVTSKDLGARLYVVQGEQGLPPAPGRNQVAVYNSQTKRVAAILNSKESADHWARVENAKIREQSAPVREP